MEALVFRPDKRRAYRVLCVGAHCDDIEIGCGGTLLALQQQARAPVIDWVVLSGTNARRRETQRAMRRLVRSRFRGDLVFQDFPNGSFPGAYTQIKAFFESLKRRPAPDLILCHERDDRHQDHRIVNEMIWNTFRDHLVLEYEIPKWDGGLGQPNVYVPVRASDARTKVEALLESYPSQSGRDWFTGDTFLALLRLRGVECRSPSGFAEAFHARKLLLATGRFTSGSARASERTPLRARKVVTDGEME
jgi:LmbE family N-acetylglucosaminyl deacetylase